MLRVSTRREAIDVLRYDELTWRLERLLLYSGDCELGCYYQRVAISEVSQKVNIGIRSICAICFTPLSTMVTQSGRNASLLGFTKNVLKSLLHQHQL